MLNKYHTILVAVKPSPVTNAVIETALSVVTEDMKVILATVIDEPNNAVEGPYVYPYMFLNHSVDESNEKTQLLKETEQAESFLNTLADHYNLYQKWPHLETKVLLGNPHRMITEELAKNEHVDCIIIGRTEKQHLVDQLTVGSTTKHVLNDATCDVLVVHAK